VSWRHGSFKRTLKDNKIFKLRLRIDCCGGGGGGETLHDHALDLQPESGVTLALHVAGGEEAVCPGGLGACDWCFLVIHAVIPEDFGFCRIGGGDLLPAVHDALGLIKVYGFGDVIWNDGIVLPQFGDAIHLHCEQNRHAFAAQVPGQCNNCRRSPTVAEEDDAGPSSFFRRQNAIVIGVEQSNDAIEGLSSMAIFKNADIGVFGDGSLDLPRELNRAVVRIVMVDESSDKADHDIGRRCSGLSPEGCSFRGLGECGNVNRENQQTNDQDTKRSNGAHANS
jgi:hypothetical protein